MKTNPQNQKKAIRTLKLISVSASFLFLFGCPPKHDVPEPAGKIKFVFEHFVDGNAAIFDQMVYTNAAGNNWELVRAQWFLSDFCLNRKDGTKLNLDQWTFYHYIDTDIPGSFSWEPEDSIDIGEYESISFVFGFTGAKNKPFMFVNPPESQMFWPYNLGGDSGGYHYMKIDGFWKDTNGSRVPFNFHLGVGQYQDANGVRLTDSKGNYFFVQNWFKVTLPASFIVEDSSKTEITLRMNMENWFKNPNVYNHNLWGPDVMENQRALKVIKENGQDVFSISKIQNL